jgi:23S rRNA maturation-related 3'-5' exoribonuclease YhaM
LYLKHVIDLDGFKLEDYVLEFCESEDVQKYFDMIFYKKPKSGKIESEYRKKIQELAVKVYNSYEKLVGWRPGQTLESYDGSTPYFNSIIE